MSRPSPFYCSTIGHAPVEAIEQRLNGVVLIEIDVRVRMVIAGQKLFDPERVRRMSGTQEHDVSETARNQLDAAEYECAHKDVAQFAVDLLEQHQLFALDLDNLPGLAHTDTHQRRTRRKHARFACELSGIERSDDGFAGTWPDDFELTRLDDEKARICGPLLDEDFSAVHHADPPVQPRTLNLSLRQHWKQTFRGDEFRHEELLHVESVSPQRHRTLSCNKNVFGLRAPMCVEMSGAFTGETLATGRSDRFLVKTIVTDEHFWLPLVVLFPGILLLVFINYVIADIREKPHLIVWAVLAGVLWAVANTPAIFAIRKISLSIAFPLWNTNSIVASCGVGFFSEDCGTWVEPGG